MDKQKLIKRRKLNREIKGLLLKLKKEYKKEKALNFALIVIAKDGTIQGFTDSYKFKKGV